MKHRYDIIHDATRDEAVVCLNRRALGSKFSASSSGFSSKSVAGYFLRACELAGKEPDKLALPEWDRTRKDTEVALASAKEAAKAQAAHDSLYLATYVEVALRNQLNELIEAVRETNMIGGEDATAAFMMNLQSSGFDIAKACREAVTEAKQMHEQNLVVAGRKGASPPSPVIAATRAVRRHAAQSAETITRAANDAFDQTERKTRNTPGLR